MNKLSALLEIPKQQRLYDHDELLHAVGIAEAWGDDGYAKLNRYIDNGTVGTPLFTSNGAVLFTHQQMERLRKALWGTVVDPSIRRHMAMARLRMMGKS